jgi:hypothetical protein
MMKKMLCIGLLVCMIAVSSFAANMDLGNFGTGYWSDPRYGVVWEFQTDGIRIIDEATKNVIYDFKTHNVQNSKVEVGTSGVVLSYDNLDNGWKYVIKKPVSLNADLEATITLNNGVVKNFPLKFSQFKLN